MSHLDRSFKLRYNHIKMSRKKITIFDTTLRDGEQTPGSKLSPEEKLKIAIHLEDLGVDVIEAGFPASSPGDFRAVKLIAEHIDKSIICALTRASIKDIDVAAEALEKAKKPRIHTGIGVSDIHIQHKLKSTHYKVLNQAVRAIKHAKTFTNDVEFYAEDAGRSELSFLKEICQAAIDAGATTLNIPDTTGFCMPNEYGEIFRVLATELKNAEKITLSTHCHNDLGMATANTISALENGAGQVECTINGIGERAGNTALEEIVMILKKKYGSLFHTSVKTKNIMKVSKLVATSMRMPVQANKAIVGGNAFAHSSGIHQDGVIKNRTTYEIIDPAEIGHQGSKIILTARSGRSALKHKLSELNYFPEKEALENLYASFLVMADQKKRIIKKDLIQLIKNNQ